MSKPVYVCFHGHFYQPPRENPWLGRIERQPSAAPFHDWNARIASECYTPNTVSRILDDRGRIDDIVNNFRYYSFNVGPTLMSWLEAAVPMTYRKILRADAESVDRHGGHGNAIAQAYNHCILPLASPEDRRTQIRWGLEEFRMRFGRPSEGMWLAETAIDMDTVRELIDQGVRFTILSPNQAARCRALGEKKWTDVASGNIDTGRAFRIFDVDAKGKKVKDRYLDVVFFHEGLSRAISFESLLRSGEGLGRAVGSIRSSDDRPQLILAATDGETFGHHQSFGDMCMAHFFDRVVPSMDMKVVNVAEFLELHPPEWEVELKEGDQGRGTAWSCAHGVGRWYRDCGCSTGGQAGWNQAWRAPLREGLNVLAEKVDTLFRKEAAALVDDVDTAWDEYIRIIVDRHEQTVKQYFDDHLALGNPGPADRSRLLTLMEMRLNAMLMFTSCAWFFADISGIETVQNMKYAARAIELAHRLTEVDLEPILLTELVRAESNVPELGSGRDIYLRWVKPSAYTPRQIVASYAVEKLLLNGSGRTVFGNYRIKQLDDRRLPDRYESLVGLVEVEEAPTRRRNEYAFFVTSFNPLDTRCYVKPIDQRKQYDKLVEVLDKSEKFWLPDLFGSLFFDWHHLVPETAEHIMTSRMADYLKQLRGDFHKRYDADRDMFEAYHRFGMDLPVELKPLISASLSADLAVEVMKLRADWDRGMLEAAVEAVEQAERFGVELDTEEVLSLLQEDMLAAAHRVRGEPTAGSMRGLIKIMHAGDKLKLKLRKDLAENVLVEMFDEYLLPEIEKLDRDNPDPDKVARLRELIDLADQLNFSPRRFEEAMPEGA